MSLSQNPNQITPRLPSWMTTTPQQPTIAVTTGLLPGQITNALILGAIGLGGLPISYTDLQWINARDPIYGVVGNGIANDTTALQNALIAAQTAGWPLYIPPGKYLLLGPLYVYTSGTVIFGAGRGLTTLVMSASFAAPGGGVTLNNHAGLIELTSVSPGDYSVLNDVYISDMTMDCTAGTGTSGAQTRYSIHQGFRLINRLRIERLVMFNASYAGGIVLEQIMSASSTAVEGQDILIRDIHAENGPYSVAVYFNAQNTSGTSVYSNIIVEDIQDFINLPIVDDRVLLAVHNNSTGGLSSYNNIVRNINTKIDPGAVASGSLVNGVKYDIGGHAYLNDILIDGCCYQGTPTATITGTMAGGLTYNGTGQPVIYLSDGTDTVGFVTIRNCTAQYAAQYRVGANPPTAGSSILIENISHQSCLAPVGAIELTCSAAGTASDNVTVSNLMSSTAVAAQGNGFPAGVAYCPQGNSQGFNGVYNFQNIVSNGFQTGFLMGYNDAQGAITGTLVGRGGEFRNFGGVLTSALFAGLFANAPFFVFRSCPGFTPPLGSLGNPNGSNNTPASGTAQQNIANYDAMVTIIDNGAGLTSVAISKNNTTYYTLPASGIAAQAPITVSVPAGCWIKVTWATNQPTWVWLYQ